MDALPTALVIAVFRTLVGVSTPFTVSSSSFTTSVSCGEGSDSGGADSAARSAVATVDANNTFLPGKEGEVGISGAVKRDAAHANFATQARHKNCARHKSFYTPPPPIHSYTHSQITRTGTVSLDATALSTIAAT